MGRPEGPQQGELEMAQAPWAPPRGGAGSPACFFPCLPVLQPNSQASPRPSPRGVSSQHHCGLSKAERSSGWAGSTGSTPLLAVSGAPDHSRHTAVSRTIQPPPSPPNKQQTPGQRAPGGAGACIPARGRGRGQGSPRCSVLSAPFPISRRRTRGQAPTSHARG